MANSNITKFNLDKFLQQKMKEERQEQIYEMVKLRSRVRKVNRALAALRKTGLYDESIAVENIFNMLESKAVGVTRTQAGNVSLRSIKGKTMTQVTAIEKAIDQFVKNKTSTVKGMEELFNERRDELARMFDDKEFVDQLTNKDLRHIYSVFQSKEYDRENKRFDSKSFFTTYIQAIDEKKDKEWFLKEMKTYQDIGQDEDLREAVEKIYDTYISNYVKR